MRTVFLAALPLLALGCGEAKSPDQASTETTGAAESVDSAAAPESARSAAPAAGSSAGNDEVLLTCETKDKLCLPKPGFAKKLCQNVYPDVALAYFRQGTPFTRGYLKGAVEAWNASGGVSSPENKLVFDEEVIVLFVRKNNTGIEVSGASGGYDVLRWDGSCATLSGEEMTFTVPPTKPKTAKIGWQYLGDAVQAALLADPAVAKINKERRDECKGATSGDVSKKCVKAVDSLSEAITNYVRGGGEVPAPAKLK